ncbi:hypothetical protein Y032_0152g2887 [Ancylostoma ceylanicum]|uniref:Uncharacterized protein n=1 Tax=Ancylostoma ceylanicum TaxID=53326 RepID=A0A016SZU2_9BILA|nr:hypothetical protein Y032_0152g2887 [Ancylostoma ceylanicum]
MLGREIEKAKELRYNISEQIDKDRLVPAYKNRIILWSRINISYNHMQFLTNEFEEDYQFSGVFEYKGRIIVYGHNVSNVLLWDGCTCKRDKTRGSRGVRAEVHGRHARKGPCFCSARDFKGRLQSPDSMNPI